MMTKKEEIKILKLKLRVAKAESLLNEEALEPYKEQATQRGARMQAMLEYMKGKDFFIPSNIQSWFYSDGSVKL